MSKSRSRILTLAQHEFRAAVRSRLLLVLLAILIAVTVASVYIGAAQYSSQLADYLAYRNAAVAGGAQRVAPSPLVLLVLLRGALEYIEIIGAITSIALGYLTVSRERSSRTLALVRSRPVTAGELATGSALGAIAIIGTVVLATAVVAVVCLGVIGHSWISGVQIPKLILAYLASIVYMFAFYCLGAMVTAGSKFPANGLLIALGIWLVVVLILPQIGDTLDADNQVPGGLFAALGLGHNGEVTILSHLTVYESIRNGIEEASLTKHFERFAFAMIDVKAQYRSFSLGQLFNEKRNDIGWMIFYSAALGAGLWRNFRNQPAISEGELS